MQLADEGIDILASPFATILSAAVAGVRGIIGDGLSGSRIGVEVVVDVEPVDVIARHDVGGHAADEVAVLWHSGVEYQQSVVGETTFGVQDILVCGGQGLRAFRFGTIGVDPRMQLHAAAVALPDHPLQRIPIRLRGRALSAGEVSAPWFKLAGIESITLDTALEEDDIDAGTVQRIEFASELALHGIATYALPLAINGLNPRSAELALRGYIG